LGNPEGLANVAKSSVLFAAFSVALLTSWCRWRW